MPYTHTTFSQLQDRLFDRLGDRVFYTNTGTYPEVTLYLREAFRVWNCLANFWRARAAFTTTANNPWYKLSSQVTNPPNLFAYTMQDRDLVAEMQTQLMEPVSPTTWTGTDMFTLPMVTRALQRRRDQYLLETSQVLSLDLISGAISSEGRMQLPETVVDVRHASWLPINSSTYSNLWRRDEWGADSTQVYWNVSPTLSPRGYSLILQPPISIQLTPPPSLGGQIEMLSVRSGTALDPFLGVQLGVPDDWTWAVKYGALADLLGQEGQSRDPSRAAYCEQRFQQGVAVASLEPEILYAQVNGLQVPIISLQELAANIPNWRNTFGRPKRLAIERDMLALYPVPDNIYSIVVDTCIPAPIPATGATQINLGPEQLDVILDYAQHIASFKESGQEFAATQRNMENMIKLASEHNSRLRAMAVFKDVFDDRSTRNLSREPARVEVTSA